MAKVEKSGGQEKETRRQRIKGLATRFSYWFIDGILTATLHYFFVVIAAMLIVLGCATTYDICRHTHVPYVYRLSDFSYSNQGVNLRNSALLYQDMESYQNFDEITGWQALESALEILDSVCPEVADWAREKYRNGEIVWETKSTGTFARYNFTTKQLTINKIVLMENNGFRASVLAHEYRHSLQDFVTVLESTISLLIEGKEKYEIAESDAHLFEYEVYIAIFGPER